MAYIGGAPDRWIAPWGDLLFGAAFSIALLVACSAGSWAGRLLPHRLLLGLGAISYSLYLTHLPILGSLKPSLLRLGFGGVGSIVVVAAVGIPLSLLSGGAFWYLFERPFLRRSPRRDIAQAEGVTRAHAGPDGLFPVAEGA